jgi:hypothetical protein
MKSHGQHPAGFVLEQANQAGEGHVLAGRVSGGRAYEHHPDKQQA